VTTSRLCSSWLGQRGIAAWIGRRGLAPGLGRRGLAAVEFAVAAPIIMLVFGAVYDLGRAIDQTIRLANAVRAGAQYALAYPDQTACTEPVLCIETVIRRAVPQTTGLAVTITGPVTGFDADACPAAAGTTCTTLIISVTAPYVPLIYQQASLPLGRSVKLRLS
jgi:Flp pilus assembly protein TadG